MCERAAARLEDPPAVVLPPLPFGVTRYGAAFAGAVGIGEATLRAVVADVAAAVAAQGFRRLVIVNNHFEPEQVATLRAAAEEAGALYLDLVRRRNARAADGRVPAAAPATPGATRPRSCSPTRPRWSTRATMAGLPAVEVDMPAAIAAGADGLRRDGDGAAYCGAPAEATADEGHATFETLTDMLVELVREARVGGALQPASWFVDRHLEEGRGDRVALLCDDRAVTYAELAALINRAGHVLRELGVRQEERVLLALSDGVEFVATWYAAQKIGAVTAEVYSFLPPKDFAYYLDYTRAGVVVVDARDARPHARGAGRLGDRPWPRTLLAVGVDADDLRDGEASFDALVADAPDALDPAPTTRDDIAIWKFTTGSTGMPKACVHRMETPLRSFEHYAQGVLGIREDDVVLPVPKLFFGYARDLAALYPFGVGGAGHRVPRAVDARAPLRARRAAPADDPRQRADDDARDARAAGRRPVEPAALHVGRRGAAGGAARALARRVRRRGARRDRLVRGVPHLHLQPAGRGAPRHARRGRARVRGAGRRRATGASCRTARPGGSGSRATPPR